MIRETFIATLSLMIFSHFCLAQKQKGIKKEVEVAIRQDEMPAPARTLLSDWLVVARRTRFYQETDGDQTSYEAKLKKEDHWYSIEFHEDGSLMDVEQLISYSSLPSSFKRNVDTYLTQSYNRHQIRRVQRQYSAKDTSVTDAEVLSTLLQGNREGLTVRFELEVDVQQRSTIGSYELLFDEQGALLQERKIIRRSLNNILY